MQLSHFLPILALSHLSLAQDWCKAESENSPVYAVDHTTVVKRYTRNTAVPVVCSGWFTDGRAAIGLKDGGLIEVGSPEWVCYNGGRWW